MSKGEQKVFGLERRRIMFLDIKTLNRFFMSSTENQLPQVCKKSQEEDLLLCDD